MMSDYEKPTYYFNDKNWRLYKAPVVPPSEVVNRLKSTKLPVEWNNTQHLGSHTWPMLYLTEYDTDGSIVTRLMPGSVQPVDGWLYK